MDIEQAKYSLNLYQNHGIKPGSFLTAVLMNDLGEVMARGDKESLENLRPIYQYVYCNLPGNIWGSRQAVIEHINSFKN